MTVVVKNKEPLVVPTAARRRAGFRSGQELEVKAAGGVITIVRKLSPDEQQDERDVRDPRIRAAIRKSHEDFLAGKTRPAEQLLAELKLMKPKNRTHPSKK
jgi:bifunctional DNA-binding transcriptional regulator/antitoxin component of YhaV-PrlF toxin-antitoxin module